MHHKTFKSNIGFPESGKDSDTFIDLDRLWAGRVQSAKSSPAISSQEPSSAVLMPARFDSTGSMMPLATSAIWTTPFLCTTPFWG